MSAYLLDTSALLAHYRNETGGEQVMAALAEPGATLFVAAVTLAEFARRLLALGFSPDAVSETVAEYRLLFDAVVDIDEAVAMAAFDMGRRTPARLPLVDALIAAAAKSRDAVLLHRDPHFSAIPQSLVKQRMLAPPAGKP